MPIYEYKCNKCGKLFSLLQSVGTTEKDTECAGCGSNDVYKMMSAFSSFSESSFSPSGGSTLTGGG